MSIRIPPPTQKMVCPHCGVTFKHHWSDVPLGEDPDGDWRVEVTTCAHCDRLIAVLAQHVSPPLTKLTKGAIVLTDVKTERMIRPRTANRKPIPPDVPRAIADDYVEAANVLMESAKASAALSRRCLQSLLVDKAGVKKRELFDQIQEVLDAGILPSDLAEDLDTVRLIGNFGTHPIKSKNTGEIVPVEPGEAEWNLDVLDDLFEFFYVRPKVRGEKRAALDLKLKEAGKPSLAAMRKKKPS